MTSTMYAQFKTDGKLETKGVQIDYGSFRVTIARAGGKNKKFDKILEARTKIYRRSIQTETMDKDLGDEVLRTVYAEAVILNWETRVDDKFKKGIEGPKGELLPVNTKNLVATFEALPDLFDDLREQANRIAIFRQEILEEDAGN